ncbi:MAG: hypothetical protein WBC70_02365 [Candidatus Aminicenantales bacterium]
MSRRRFPRQPHSGTSGFTLIELLVGGTIMLVVIIGALAVYSRSNKIAVDQSQYAELQHDVRSAMYLLMRDARMAGVGLPEEFGVFALEGVDNEDQGAEVQPDRFKLIGNIEEPLSLGISQYQGSSVVVTVDDFSFEQYPYLDDYYVNKTVLILPNPSSPCRAGEIRIVTHVTHSSGGTNERLDFSPGLAPGIDPPGGLSGTCPDPDNYDGGLVTFVDVKEYWLDVTGNYSGLTAGQNGYLGGGAGGVLYQTKNGVHYPMAANIENFQAQYNGDLDDDQLLDGFQDWNAAWTLDQVGRIRQVRVWILGRTASRFVSVSGTPPGTIHHYRRPAVANSPASAGDDLHRRFLLESASNVRNLSLSLYNRGER